jgi:radical SAM superfamily enzyme YgiQ (UPF0313 family)
MRIIFVDNLLLEFRDGAYQFALQPHLGLISLIAVAEQAGHEGLLYDPKVDLQRKRLPLDSTLYRRIAEAILAQSPDVVGLTTLGCNFICTAKIAAHLKAAHPELPILLGGPHATILAAQILRRFPQFDVVVRHEAELTILKVLDGLPGGRFDLIPGVTFRSGDDVISNPGEPLISDLDSLPWPAFHRYPIAELGLDSIPVEAGRGCPFACTFCSTASFFGRKFRLKSATRIRDEMDFLHTNYGIKHFSLTHDLFTVNRKKVVEFSECIAPRGYSWSCSARMDCVDEGLLEIMRASGCRSVYYGIETGSERMQKVVEKRQDLSMVAPVLDISNRIGMFSTVSLITGYPQEEQSDQDDTLDLVGRCFSRDPSLVRVQLHLLTPEPGTKLINEFAHALEYDGHITDFNFPTLEADDADVMASNPEVFMNHHYFRTAVERGRHVFVTSMFQLLYELGFPVLRHILTFYDGRFSRLIADMYDWSKAGSPTSAPSDELIDAFVAHRWGEDSYLHSLVRYITSANQLSLRAAQEQAFDRENSEGAQLLYRLSSRAALLPGAHDCQRLLELLTASADGMVTFPPELVRERADYCVVLEDSEERMLRNYQLEEGWTQIYNYFQTPRSHKQCVRKLRDDAGRDADALLETLVECGILQQTTSRTNTPWVSVARTPSYSISNGTPGYV